MFQLYNTVALSILKLCSWTFFISRTLLNSQNQNGICQLVTVHSFSQPLRTATLILSLYIRLLQVSGAGNYLQIPSCDFFYFTYYWGTLAESQFNFCKIKKIFHCVDIPHFVYPYGHLAIINGSIVSMSLQMTTIVWGFSLFYCITRRSL